MSNYPELTELGKQTSKCGQHNSIGEGPGINTKEKVSCAQAFVSFASRLWMRCDQLPHALDVIASRMVVCAPLTVLKSSFLKSPLLLRYFCH